MKSSLLDLLLKLMKNSIPLMKSFSFVIDNILNKWTNFSFLMPSSSKIFWRSSLEPKSNENRFWTSYFWEMSFKALLICLFLTASFSAWMFLISLCAFLWLILYLSLGQRAEYPFLLNTSFLFFSSSWRQIVIYPFIFCPHCQHLRSWYWLITGSNDLASLWNFSNSGEKWFNMKLII